MNLLRRALTLGVVALLLVCSAVVAYLYLQHRERTLWLGHTQNVVTAVRDLARLETAEYHIERIIDLKEQQQRMLGLVQGEDAVLLIAAGDVIAGIDLGKLSEKDFEIDMAARKATVHLPPPEVFHARLDEQHTYVYQRRTDLLASRNERLEGKARELALESFEKAARDSGILDRARSQADRLLRVLLRELGMREITLVWR